VKLSFKISSLNSCGLRSSGTTHVLNGSQAIW
jgi:hypothetical protein